MEKQDSNCIFKFWAVWPTMTNSVTAKSPHTAKM